MAVTWGTEEEMLRDLRILYGIAPPADDKPETYTDTSMKPTPGKIETYAAQFPSENRKRIAQAYVNKQNLDRSFAVNRQAALDEGERQLGNRFGEAISRQTATLASRGLSGGSAERSLQRRTIGDLLIGRQRLVSAADSADATAKQALDSQRMDLEGQIKLGTAPNLASINALQAQKSGMDQAYRGLTEQAIGNLFAQGGDLYRDINSASAEGRRGWNVLFPTYGKKTSNSGSYSGG